MYEVKGKANKAKVLAPPAFPKEGRFPGTLKAVAETKESKPVKRIFICGTGMEMLVFKFSVRSRLVMKASWFS